MSEPMDTKESKQSLESDKSCTDADKEHCSSLDRIMCQIVDELNCDMA